MSHLLSAREKLIELRAQLDEIILSLEPVVAPCPRQLAWGARVSAEFRASVFWIEEQLHLNPDYLMAVMAFETGVTFSPSKRNPASSATGLIQFMRATAIQLGTTTEALAEMSAVKQLSYVYKYFKQFGDDLSSWDLADTYMAVLLPTMIGKPLDTPMTWGKEAHRVNKGLDADKNGVITKREAFNKVNSMLTLGMEKENMA